MPSRKRKTSSKARVRASRANGKKGGPHGVKGGRPRDTLPDDVVARLGPIPTTLAGLRRWNARLAAEIVLGEATGRIPRELAERLRVGVGSIQKLLPELKAASIDDEDDDEDGDDGDDGPALEDDAPAGTGGFLRVD